MEDDRIAALMKYVRGEISFSEWIESGAGSADVEDENETQDGNGDDQGDGEAGGLQTTEVNTLSEERSEPTGEQKICLSSWRLLIDIKFHVIDFWFLFAIRDTYQVFSPLGRLAGLTKILQSPSHWETGESSPEWVAKLPGWDSMIRFRIENQGSLPFSWKKFIANLILCTPNRWIILSTTIWHLLAHHNCKIQSLCGYLQTCEVYHSPPKKSFPILFSLYLTGESSSIEWPLCTLHRCKGGPFRRNM